MKPNLILNEEAIQGWIVYAWMRGPEYLYVGSSAKGISRFANHHIIDKLERFDRDDKIEVYFCQSQIDAVTTELKLILDKKPRLNTIGKKSEPRRNNGLISQSWRESFKEQESKGPSMIVIKEATEEKKGILARLGRIGMRLKLG